MADDSVKKTLQVALGICLVCSLLVSTAAVSLSTRQQRNKRIDQISNILVAGGLYSEDIDVEQTYNENIVPVMIDMESGEKVGEDQFDDILNPEDFDIKAVAEHPLYGQDIPADLDLANIGRRPKIMLVYLVKQNGEITNVILPIYGKGLWSTLYGFLALEKDLKTISGITFYEHGETPGLGGEVDNPAWKANWNGKQAFDEDGNVRISVIKGRVDRSRAEAKYQVDGLSGATITARGVDQLVKYWLGENGYGVLLSTLHEAD